MENGAFDWHTNARTTSVTTLEKQSESDGKFKEMKQKKNTHTLKTRILVQLLLYMQKNLMNKIITRA